MRSTHAAVPADRSGIRGVPRTACKGERAARVPLRQHRALCISGIDAGSHHGKSRRDRRRRQSAFHQLSAKQPAIPSPIIRQMLIDIYKARSGHCGWPAPQRTGYGEEIDQKRLSAWISAWWRRWPTSRRPGTLCPDVDFVIDIGGQDMKCFKIEDGAIDNIFLNEACCSGLRLAFCRRSQTRWATACRSLRSWLCLPDKPVDLGTPLHGVHELQRSSRPRRTARPSRTSRPGLPSAW